MEIIVFAERFENGIWKFSDHLCEKDEILALNDSALAKAFDRGNFSGATHIDYLKGAESLFNVFRGGPQRPAAGDTRVFGIKVSEIVIAQYRTFRAHFELKRTA